MAQFKEIEPIQDRESIVLHFTGGVQAQKINDTQWMFGPVLHKKKSCLFGPLSQGNIAYLANKGELKKIAIQNLVWHSGKHSTHWTAFIGNKADPYGSPAAEWQNISRNLNENSISQNILNQLNSLSPEERLIHLSRNIRSKSKICNFSKFISLSIRSADAAMEKICEIYNENLEYHLRKGIISSGRYCSVMNDDLFANIHSLYMHLGSARDYLASLIARVSNIDKNIDSYTTLCQKIKKNL